MHTKDLGVGAWNSEIFRGQIAACINNKTCSLFFSFSLFFLLLFLFFSPALYNQLYFVINYPRLVYPCVNRDKSKTQQQSLNTRGQKIKRKTFFITSTTPTSKLTLTILSLSPSLLSFPQLPPTSYPTIQYLTPLIFNWFDTLVLMHNVYCFLRFAHLCPKK